MVYKNSYSYHYSNKYLTTLYGECVSATFDYDLFSDVRKSCTLEMILEDDSFLINNENSYVWYGKIFRIWKTYEYQNDGDRYPEYIWNKEKGLWNNNGVRPSNPAKILMGWFLPNQSSYSYNPQTRTLSISCIDTITSMDTTRSGVLLDVAEDNFPENYWAHSGLTLEGSLNQYNKIEAYGNYFIYLKENESHIHTPDMWYEHLARFMAAGGMDEDLSRPIGQFTKPRDTTIYSIFYLINRMLYNFKTTILNFDVNIDLYKDDETLPYDLEFDASATVLEVLRTIKDLYPNQTMFFDDKNHFIMNQLPMVWTWDGEKQNDATWYRANELMDIVIDEQPTFDLSNIINYMVVYGKDMTVSGKYEVRSGAGCYNCGRIYPWGNINPDSEYGMRYCPYCQETYNLNIPLEIMNDENRLSIDRIGKMKGVETIDTLLTVEECTDYAKWLCYQNNRIKDTLSLTISDRYISMFHWHNKGVGERIEYKSRITGETNVYLLQKLSHDHLACTWTLQLERFYPYREEDFSLRLPTPTFTASVDENGLMTMIISSAWSDRSLFKVYLEEKDPAVPYDEPTVSGDTVNRFIGETCEVYTDGISKVFYYQFKENGTYTLKVSAYNPNYAPSVFSQTSSVDVTNFDKYIVLTNGDRISIIDDDTIEKEITDA